MLTLIVILFLVAGYSSFVQDPATTRRVTSDRGFIIEADSPIYVSVRLNARQQRSSWSLG